MRVKADAVHLRGMAVRIRGVRINKSGGFGLGEMSRERQRPPQCFSDIARPGRI